MAPKPENSQGEQSSRKWFHPTSLQVPSTWPFGSHRKGASRQQETSEANSSNNKLDNDGNFAIIDGPDGALPARVRPEPPEVEPLPELRKDRSKSFTQSQPRGRYTKEDVMRYFNEEDKETATTSQSSSEVTSKRKQRHNPVTEEHHERKKSRVIAPTPGEYRLLEIQQRVEQMKEGIKDSEWEMVYKADKERLDEDDDDASIVSVDDCPNGEELLDWQNQHFQEPSKELGYRVKRVSTLITSRLKNLTLESNQGPDNSS
jgi:hypothetical protein